MGWVLLRTVTWAERPGSGAAGTMGAQRSLSLILVLRHREDFIEEKPDLEGWVGFSRQGREMPLPREREWNEQEERRGNFPRHASGKLSK